MKVIVIDYKCAKKEVLAGQLKKLHKKEATVLFKSFKEALEYLEHASVDLVLLSSDKDECRWMEKFRKIKGISKDIEVMLMKHDGKDLDSAGEYGVMDFLFKPLYSSAEYQMIVG